MERSLSAIAGSTGNTLADDKPNIYIYLDSSGNLVTNEYDGFPDMADTLHIRLAVVTTSGGDIVSITDSRQGHNFVVPRSGSAELASRDGGVRQTHQANKNHEQIMFVTALPTMSR